MTTNYQSIRRDYGETPLDVDSLPPDPMTAFADWFAKGVTAEALDGNAFVLSTIDEQGYPDARVLLVKSVSEQGFTFFTNYNSVKGEQLAISPKAYATFYWPALGRQIRLRGQCQKMDHSGSVAYFSSRPLESQFAAMASEQSQVIPDRTTLETKLQQLKDSGETPVCPDSWGGYLFTPSYAEFFQGRNNRLNDRIAYLPLDENNVVAGWRKVRLSP